MPACRLRPSHSRRSACGRSRRARRERRARRRAPGAVGAWLIAASIASTRASPMRLSMQIAPCPGAGGNFSSGIRSVTTLCRPSRFRPASARIVPSATPSSQLAQPRLHIAAEGHDLEIGPHAAGSAPGGAATTSRPSRPAGRSMIDFAALPMKASRASSRGRKAESSSPSGSTRRHVLRGMHGDVDAAGKQRFLDLLGEQALAAGFRQRPVLDAVAAGRDRPRWRRLLPAGRAPPSAGRASRAPAPAPAGCRVFRSSTRLFAWRGP